MTRREEAPRPAAPSLRATLTPIADWKALGLKWRELEARSKSSFFQSWTWIGSWLSAMPGKSDLFCVEVTENQRRVGMTVVGRHTSRRRLLIRSRTLSLNETGRPEFDRGYIEYNAPVAERGRERDVLFAVMDCLLSSSLKWDELRLSGIEESVYSGLRTYTESARLNLLVRGTSQSHLVDLDAVRARAEGYMSLLSANTRQQIRRSLKAYGQRGAVEICVAQSMEQANEFFSGLRALHQTRWEERGAAGAFGTEFSLRFHQRLVRLAFENGELQLARVRAGSEVIGYLYNFVRDGHVYFYQNGIDYAAAGKLQPGLVAHYLAINYNAERGHRVYDLLAGDRRYKRSLAQTEYKLYWVTVQKRRARFALEAAFVRAFGDARHKSGL